SSRFTTANVLLVSPGATASASTCAVPTNSRSVPAPPVKASNETTTGMVSPPPARGVPSLGPSTAPALGDKNATAPVAICSVNALVSVATFPARSCAFTANEHVPLVGTVTYRMVATPVASAVAVAPDVMSQPVTVTAAPASV